MGKFSLLYLMILVIILGGCSQLNQEQDKIKGDKLMNEISNPLSDFEKLRQKELPKTTAKQTTENVAKLYFYAIENLSGSNNLIIDLQNKVAQLNPRTAHFFGETEVAEFDVVLSEKNVEEVRTILENNHISEWKEKYSYGDDSTLEQMNGEGYTWTLLIQYVDGTMEEKTGKGTKQDEIEPKEYQTFVKEINKFINSIETID